MTRQSLAPLLSSLVIGCGSGAGLEVYNYDASTSPDASEASDSGVDERDEARADAPSPDSGDARTPDEGGEPLPALRDDTNGTLTWAQKVELATNSDALAAHYSSEGFNLPAGGSVFAARIEEGSSYASYAYFEAGQGGFSLDFWPASTIKLLSSLGALEWVYEQGFTGAANITWDSGFGDRISAIYDRAIRVSSNIDYDRTLRMAGWDQMNAVFLTPERGFPQTVITSSYASVEVRNPGGYTLTEGGNSQYIAARAGVGDYGRNDTNLFELSEGVRRVMLDREVPESERFRIDPADLARVQEALCGATPSYFSSGASTALGGTQSICHKPGWVPNNECLDHAVVTASNGARFLLAAEVPYQADCPSLSNVARHTLEFLRTAPATTPLQADVGDVSIQLDDRGTNSESRRDYTITVDVPGAQSVELYVDEFPIGEVASGDRGRFVLDYAFWAGGARLLSVRGHADGKPVAFRAAPVTLTAP